MSSHYSDEHLNAYLDNQLDTEERSMLLEAIRKDQELAARVCKLQKVQDMVQLAYHSVANNEPAVPQHPGVSRHFAQAAAAVVILGMGIMVGWFSNNGQFSKPTLVELAQDTQLSQKSLASNEWKLMLHVNTGDARRLETVLDETEQLLKTSQASQRKVKIEVLTNGPGLALLQNEGSQFAKRIQQLDAEYDNISFMACQIAINRYNSEHEFEIQLLPNAEIVPSAIHQTMLRQKEGWSYLRI